MGNRCSNKDSRKQRESQRQRRGGHVTHKSVHGRIWTGWADWSGGGAVPGWNLEKKEKTKTWVDKTPYSVRRRGDRPNTGVELIGEEEVNGMVTIGIDNIVAIE